MNADAPDQIKRSSSSGSDQLLSEDVVRKCVDLGRDEFVHHSSVIWKINQRGKPQKRNLLITNFAVYNLTPTVGSSGARTKGHATTLQGSVQSSFGGCEVSILVMGIWWPRVPTQDRHYGDSKRDF
eukprot:562198-Amorphochlora_amoeboformis.AAC.1